MFDEDLLHIAAHDFVQLKILLCIAKPHLETTKLQGP